MLWLSARVDHNACVLQINRAKFQIYTIFAEVPLSVIKQLANQARMRFEKMQVELEADQEGHSSDDRSEVTLGRCDHLVM